MKDEDIIVWIDDIPTFIRNNFIELDPNIDDVLVNNFRKIDKNSVGFNIVLVTNKEIDDEYRDMIEDYLVNDYGFEEDMATQFPDMDEVEIGGIISKGNTLYIQKVVVYF